MGRGLGLAVCALACASSTAAHAASLSTLPPGQRPGPDVLYADPPRAPQLENTGIWQAPPILVSGAVAYRAGELVYQDHLFDDHGARGAVDPAEDSRTDESFSQAYGTLTYPTDRERFAGNAADLVEVRLKPLADAIAFRLTFNAMPDPERVGTTLALGDGPPVPVPHGAGTSMPGQVFVTVHGSTADARSAGGAPLPAPAVAVDRERKQIEVRVPRSAWDPGTGTARVAAASGLWDPDAGAYLLPGRSRTATRPGGGGPSAFFNVAFRTDEPLPEIQDPTEPFLGPAWWRDRAQGDALADGVLTELGLQVDFGKLAAGTSDESGVPRTGPIDRILASRFSTFEGVDFAQTCGSGGKPDGCTGAYGGQLQPYALYVPDTPAPATGHGLTLLLHSLGGNHNQYLGSRNQSQLGDRTSGHLVATPLGRGPDGWYVELAEADTFEVWADIARHYRLDPDRTAITGYSMGGYGTYRLGSRYPDLFGAANTTVGPPTEGISVSGEDSTSDPRTSTRPQLEGFRHIPVIVWAGTTDQLVPFTSVEAQVQRLEELGFRYTFDAFTPADHFALAVNDQFAPVADFLGDARVVRDPARVSYALNTAMDFPARGVVADHAYWLSRIEPASPGRATIDARSDGLGDGEPVPQPVQASAGTLTGGTFATGPSYVRRAKAWAPGAATPRADRLTITATNVRAVTVAPRRAGLTCAAEIEVRSSTPVAVTLAGCAGAATPAATAPRPCASAPAFARARVTPRGGGLRLDLARRGGGAFRVDVFRQSAGRRVLGERRAARFVARRRPFTWAARAVPEGTYLVRATAGRDVRRFVVRRTRGRFVAAPASDRRRGCGLVRAFKLERPVFGGDRNRALGISFRLAREGVVSVRVLRGRRVVRAFRPTTRRPGATHRLRLPSERLARGLHRVVLDVRPVSGGAPVRAVLAARRL